LIERCRRAWLVVICERLNADTQSVQPTAISSGGNTMTHNHFPVQQNRQFVLASVAVLGLLLTSCASSDQARVTDAAKSPLNDLNLVQAEIPAALLVAQKAPYAIPVDATCATFATEITELDAVLGADLDTPPSDKNPSLIERGSTEARNAAGGALKSAAEGIVPFRGWVRKLSGAERYSKQVAAAITAGTVRRAFLKGLRVSKSCG
jgi:hypothetical protein